MDKLLSSISKFSGPLIALIIGLIASKIIIVILRKTLRRSKLDESLHKFLINTVKFIIFVVVLMIILDQFNVDTKSMITVLGISGGAVALALKDSLSNIAGGVIIIVTKPFNKGDFVDINGTSGTVHNIDMLITTLITYDNKTITIPNGVVSSSVITNYTKADLRRVDCNFGISYDADIIKAKKILADVAKENPMILDKPQMVLGVIENSSSSVNLDFKVWTKTENYWPVKYFLEENVKLAFDKEGIVIPYNQLDININKR